MFSLVAVTGGQPGPGRPGGVTVTQHPGCPGPVPRAGSDSATRRRSRSRHRAARRACKCPAPTPGPRATAPGRPRRRPGDPQGRARRHSKFSETRPCWPGRSGRALIRRPAARRAESAVTRRHPSRYRTRAVPPCHCCQCRRVRPSYNNSRCNRDSLTCSTPCGCRVRLQAASCG